MHNNVETELLIDDEEHSLQEREMINTLENFTNSIRQNVKYSIASPPGEEEDPVSYLGSPRMDPEVRVR